MSSLKSVLTIGRREVSVAFHSPVAYIVIGAFLVVAGWKFFFFPGFFLLGRASFRTFFDWMPAFLGVLGPALTMRALAEERKSGTIESLMTLPMREHHVVLGKWLGSLAVLTVGLLISFVFTLSVAPFAVAGQGFDWGPVLGGYFGSFCMAAAFVAVGVLASALTKDQVVSFVIAIGICAVSLILSFAIFVLPATLAEPVQYLSSLYHFESLGRGVVDWRDVLYFVTLTAVALLLSTRVVAGLRRPGADIGGGATVTLVAASLVIANVLAIGLPLRVDLTRDNIYTLSEATRDSVKDLDAPVTVTAYFTKNLPPPFSDNARYVKDLLEEYRAASSGNLSFSFIDPEEEETQEDKDKKKDVKRDFFGRVVREKTSVETELEGLGIAPVEIRVLEDDQAQQKRAYMGVAVRFGEKKEALPIVQDTSTLEYDLTSIIRRLVREKQPVLGMVQGHGEPSPDDPQSKLKGLLEQNYEVRAITITPDAPIPEDVSSLPVIGPNQAYSEEELKAIDSFLMKGKSAAFFLDRAQVELRAFQPTPVQHNVETLTAAYGIELGTQLVGDKECAQLNVAEKRGFFVVQMPLKYPFIPMLKKLEGDSPLTKGLTDLAIPFAAPVYTQKLEGVEIWSLAKSSPMSWLEEATPENLSPRRDYGQADITATGPYDLVATARGSLPSKYEPAKKSEGEARVLVAGSSTMLDEQLLGPANAAFFMNIVDWLMLDNKMLAMRSRSVGETPLNPDVSDGTKTAVKWGNLIGVPLLLLVVGAVRWQLRAKKRRRLSVVLP